MCVFHNNILLHKYRKATFKFETKELYDMILRCNNDCKEPIQA